MISLGRLLAMHLKDTLGAEKLFTKAWDCGGAPIEALICLGEVKFIEGLYMESHEYFNHALQLDPALPDPKLGLAHVYLETKRFDLAIENLTAVVRDGPEEARIRAHYLLYRTYREVGEDRRAVKHLEQVPSSFFMEPEVLDEIAVHLESEKMYTKAREFAERAMVLRATGRGRADESDALSTP
jgi:tetratricopeptide (TPR) repeat protein